MPNPALLLSQLETDLMVSIVKHLSKGNIGTAAWQAEKLAQFGTVSRRLAKQIQESTPEVRAALSTLLDDAAKRAANGVDAAIPKTWAGSLPADADEALRAVLFTWDTAAAEAINQLNAKMLGQAREMYTDVIEKATAEVLSGVKAGRAAIVDTSRALAKQGLSPFVDAAGRRWTTEAYAQTIIRSNVRNVTTNIQLERAQQWGKDLMGVTSHVGARPGCEPYQGRVFSISGDSKNYPALAETTMGDVDGLFGINCGHDLYPYTEGEPLLYKPYPKEENDRAYENSQRQRLLERNIRAAKRDLEIAQATGVQSNIDRAKKSVSHQQGRMRDFIDNTGRTRRSGRERI